MPSQTVLCELNISRGICTSRPQKKPEDKNYLWDKNSTYTLIYAVFSHKKFPMVLSRLPRQHLLLRHAGERRGQGASTGVWGSLRLLLGQLPTIARAMLPLHYINSTASFFKWDATRLLLLHWLSYLLHPHNLHQWNSSKLKCSDSNQFFQLSFPRYERGRTHLVGVRDGWSSHRFHPSSPPSYSLFNFSYASVPTHSIFMVEASAVTSNIYLPLGST